MKVLYLVANSSLNPEANTGYGRHIRETVTGLRNLGHEVMVICAGKFEANYSGLNSQEIPTKRRMLENFRSILPTLLWESLKDVRQLMVNRRFKHAVRQAIASFQPDAIYERTCYLSNTIKMNDFYKIPWYLEINAPFVLEREKISGRSALSWLAHRFEFQKYSRACYLFCVSKVLANFIAERYKVTPIKITVNHNGVDENLFLSNTQGKTEMDDRFIFGFVGSIMPYHGVEMLLDAFARVHLSIPHACLMIVGDGLTLSELKARAADLGLESSIQFTGGVSQDKIPQLINSMDVCMLPSTAWYCSPIKLFEYGIMCKPVIAPRLPPIMEVIEDKVDGILVEGQVELQQAMCFCYENPSKGKEMAITFKEKVKSTFTWQKNVQRIEKVILGS